jgi:hypothetical protein
LELSVAYGEPIGAAGPTGIQSLRFLYPRIRVCA